MITCRTLSKFLDGYLDGTLAPKSREAVDRHLAVCPECVRYLAQYRQTIAVGRRAFDDDFAPAPGSVPAGLLKVLISARPAD